VITTEQQVPGYRNPLWLPRALRPDENVAVQQALAEIETRLTPATKAAIVAHLGRLMNTAGTEQKLSASEVDAKLNDYAYHLAEFSEPHFVTAISEHVRDEKWFPKVSELRERLLFRRTTAVVMRRRARILLGLDQASTWELDLAARLESERQQREAEPKGPSPELSERIAKLPPPLAESVQRMMDGARKIIKPCLSGCHTQTLKVTRC
jgi:hypothetical protein